jgi:hypothetical protein
MILVAGPYRSRTDNDLAKLHMDFRRASRDSASRSFWRDVAGGLTSPKRRAGFERGYRDAVLPGAIGGFMVLKWMNHSRAIANRPPLGAAEGLP